MFRKTIIGCHKRHRESQKELYEMFYAYGMSITLRYADSREEAVTILNDAFLKVFDNIRKYDADRPFKPWLRKIIVNTAINNFHKNKARRDRERFDAAEKEIADREMILSGISYAEIINMVQQLTPAYRTVFNLYVIEGYKHQEIAEKLGISVGTSKSNLAKAKKNLRVILEKNLML